MKKFKIISLIVIITIALNGCTTRKTSSKENNFTCCDYKEIYDGSSKVKHEKISSPLDYNRASYGYRFNEIQGYNSWYFNLVNTERHELIAKQNVWLYDGNNYLNNDGIIKTTDNNKIEMLYKVSQNGEYLFAGTLKSNNVENISGRLDIYINGLLQKEYSYEVICNDTEGKYINGKATLKTNDELSFRLSGLNVYFNPVITKSNTLDYSLYKTFTDWGYYGDIHCYYYNNILHLYHLWNHTGKDDGWMWYMQDTVDMFRYENKEYDDSFIKNHYMKYGTDPDVFASYVIVNDKYYNFDREKTINYDNYLTIIFY